MRALQISAAVLIVIGLWMVIRPPELFARGEHVQGW